MGKKRCQKDIAVVSVIKGSHELIITSFSLQNSLWQCMWNVPCQDENKKKIFLHVIVLGASLHTVEMETCSSQMTLFCHHYARKKIDLSNAKIFMTG